MKREDQLRVADYLRHIVEPIENIQSYTAGFDVGSFMSDRRRSLLSYAT